MGSLDCHTNKQCVSDKTGYTVPHNYILWWKIRLWRLGSGDLRKMPSSFQVPTSFMWNIRFYETHIAWNKAPPMSLTKIQEWVHSAMVLGLISSRVGQLSSLLCPLAKEDTIISLPNGSYGMSQGAQRQDQRQHPSNKTNHHSSPTRTRQLDQ